MSEPITYVGIDTHARELHLAMLIGNAAQPIVWTAPNEPRAIERLRRRLERDAPGAIACCYEAGPTGYVLQRRLTTDRIQCRVIAPSLIPEKPGDRIKTDRRDARKLAQLLRADVLTSIQPPTEGDEAVRDLVRARDDARVDLMRARHRLSKLLLRRGHRYARTPWTLAFDQWLRQLAWPHPAEQYVVRDYQLAIVQVEARLRELEQAIAGVAITPPYARAVAALRCFRGIDTVTALTLLAELYDIRRFTHPRALMAFVGLVPSESSTGDRHKRGGLTRAGNTLVRRLLIQTAWQYHHHPRLGPGLRQRREGQPASILAIAIKAEQRLCHRYRRLCARQKPKPLVIATVARELVGFIWAMLQLPDARSSS
jgi:transposase